MTGDTANAAHLPGDPTLHLKATELQLAGQYEEAASTYQHALSSTPNDPHILSNYGGLLAAKGSFDQAFIFLSRAVSLAPDLADAWCNLGNALQQMQRYDDAIAAYARCLRQSPEHTMALSNLGVALDAKGEHAAAQNFHRVAVRLAPNNPENHTNHALSLLAAGDYPAGLQEYEWRWRVRTTEHHGIPGPTWNGAPFEGRTLLIHTEGGFGDMLQFARFIPLAKARGGRVIVRLRSELAALIERSTTPDLIVMESDPLPDYDIQIPVLSLPLALGTTLETIPFPAGYLITDSGKAARWRDILQADDTSLGFSSPPLRIGLVWAGAPHRGVRDAAFVDSRRSTTLHTLAPLVAAVPDAVFYSLQIGEAASQAKSPPPGMSLIDHTALLKSFDDTAALISQLDMVIAVDTSTAHVAAAQGKPTWMLSRYDQCWRWLSGRNDSPWYASLRLYQQETPLDWSTPLQKMTLDLKIISRTLRAEIVAA
ncbi:tetratricopeptide repeat protein [Acetobacter sp. DsW_063]|uniref:tetratricopeptide repeat-containing glycosyltransferase family protein n=1 Tax=Acetobacter sp. DsW_063 TaxID=1514894 RepID=UPI000A36AFE7|nr:tetratricopeptide repeat-containing glycosyltransferase family protein [Acetobacter sp. DsW_063]